MLTGRRIAFRNNAFKINDVQGTEVRNDNLKMFDQAWEDTLMAMAILNLTWPFAKVLAAGSWKTSTIMKNALALHHMDQVHREESKSHTKKDILEDQQQDALLSQKGKGRVKDMAITVVLFTKGDGKKGVCRQCTPEGS